MTVPFRIDPHVHCRDGKQAHKGTIALTFQIAEKQGIRKIIDMPNTDPAILDSNRVAERLQLAPRERREDYFLHVGLTADQEQVRQAVRAYDDFPEVVSFKLYAGHSTGNLGVVTVDQQRTVWQTLAESGYTGPVAVHCEKEGLLKPHLWDPLVPATHCSARPKDAEIASVTDQLALVEETGFKGTMYVAHVSCPESLEFIDAARTRLQVAAEVTPHHLMWDDSRMYRHAGLIYKMNPPLRDLETVTQLRKLAQANKVDFIGTDHAPHTVGEKLHDGHPSGYPALYLYGELVNTELPALGLSEQQIDAMTYHNIRRVFPKVK